MECICGDSRAHKSAHIYYTVTKAGETVKARGKLPLLTCDGCGVVRQSKPPYTDNKGAEKFYSSYEPVSEKYLSKTYEHDRCLAVKRCKDYGLTSGCEDRILDVGAGSGAFVDECRARGAAAFGCEIAKYSYSHGDSFIYHRNFQDIHFPTDHFNLVTCHDVLEHTVNPKEFIDELFRVTDQSGRCIIDFPNFYISEGEHHWKKEHLWYLTADQLKAMIKQAGFKVEKIRNPIQSKTVFFCTKPPQSRPTILLPPGLGDSFWSITKLQAFLEREGLGIPDVYIASPRDKAHNGHKRSVPFLEMFPFLNVTGEVRHANGPHKAIWREAYAKTGRTVFKDVLDCDYFISYNGHLRVGKRMEEVDPDLNTAWQPPMFVSLEQDNFKDECLDKYGKYIVFYWPLYGTYKHWTRQFPVPRIAEYINLVHQRTGCMPIFTGAKWDSEDSSLQNVMRQTTTYVDLTGKTSIQRLFGLMRGAEAVVGYPSGLTITAACLKLKTLIIWNDYYNRQFAWHCAPDEVKNKTYFIENTRGLTPEGLVEITDNIIKGSPVVPRRIVINHDNKELNPPDNLPPQVAQRTRKTVSPIQCDAGELVENGNYPLTIACVLKSGGCFTEEYVEKLKSMVERTVKVKHNFVVLTDHEDFGIYNIQLDSGLPGWWSKLELFRLKGPVLYLDLDTVIVDDITDLAKSVIKMKENEFRMLIPFNPARRRAGNWASGAMAWHGDFRFIINGFNVRRQGKGWDQVFIFRTLERNGIRIKAINDFAAIYSYKRHCAARVPKDSKIICFHGADKPHTSRSIDFVNTHWR